MRRADAEVAARIPHLHEAIATKNVIAHQYADVDYERVRDMLKADVPDLIVVLESLLTEFGPPQV